jgi:hypothetical protein
MGAIVALLLEAEVVADTKKPRKPFQALQGFLELGTICRPSL